MVGHFDACLGCMACVTACPSGVQYDKLIERTRAQVERRHERPLRERVVRSAIFATFPYPKRLQLLRGPLRLYQRSGLQSLVRRSGVLDRLPGRWARWSPWPRPGAWFRQAAAGVCCRRRDAVIGLLTSCVQGAFFPGVNAATARVLAMEARRRHPT
jgi:glycolate oxidase iron-sulfur subunit